MLIDLTDTNSAKINGALLEGRRKSGSPAMGMVLTLVIVTDEKDHYDASRAANEAAREHPSRILVAVRRPGGSVARLDAEVRVGGESGPGEVVLLRMHGPLADHADSVVLPLLLPDAPVVAWWAGGAPPVISRSDLGLLAQRRVTDAATCPKPIEELIRRSETYAPGDTDLAWTRLTPWRTLLASALDEPYGTIERVEVSAENQSASAELLAVWLGDRLHVPVERETTDGPGITGVVLHTSDGPISVTRPDGRLAALQRPGQPERAVALPRRTTAELIAEELRRLDPDDAYGTTLHLIRRQSPAKAAAKGRSRAAADAGAAERADRGPGRSKAPGAGERHPGAGERHAGS